MFNFLKNIPFLNKNNKTTANSYCLAIANGKVLEGNAPMTRKYYIGVDTASVNACCPSLSELQKMFPNSQQQDPVYVGTTEVEGKTVPNVRIDFYTFNANMGINCRFSIFLTKSYVKGNTSGKIQVIDKYGRTGWVTPDELKEHATLLEGKNGKYQAQLDPDYRPCFRGEPELTKLIKCLLGIDDVRQWSPDAGKYVDIDDPERLNDCVCRFELEDLEQFFKGKFGALKEYVNYPTKNDVKFMFGVRTASNGNIYQDICASEFMKATQRGTYDFEQLLNGRTFNNVEYSLEPLHEYNAQPTAVAMETTVEQPAPEASFDPMSDMPF